LFRDLEADRLVGLVLHDTGPRQNMIALSDIAHAQTHQSAPAQLAVNRQVPSLCSHAQPRAHRPDLGKLQRWLLTDQLALFPRSAIASVGVCRRLHFPVSS
jgi:hypothetical protein